MSGREKQWGWGDNLLQGMTAIANMISWQHVVTTYTGPAKS